MASDQSYEVRKRFSSISIVKAVFVTLIITLFFVILIVRAPDYMSQLNAELFTFYTLYLIPILLYIYALKKKGLSVTAIFRQPNPDYKLLWIVVPMLALTIGIVWSTLLFLNVMDTALAESYLEWLISYEALTITSDTIVIQYILIFVVISVLAPVIEEVVFRGILVERFGLKYGYSRAVIISSLIFGILHADIIGAFIFGVILCVIYLQTKSLMMPVLIHALNNGSATLVIFFEDETASEMWETLTPYIDYAWVGILIFVAAVVWCYQYLKKNWDIVNKSRPFEPDLEDPTEESR